MKKFFFTGAFLLSFSFLFAQSNQGSQVTATGIATFKPYIPTVGPDRNTTLTDLRGQFIFNAVGVDKKASKDFFSFDMASNKWVKSDIDDAKILLISGKTDPNIVVPGNSIQVIYWKDQSGTYWCMSSFNNNDYALPKQLEEIWAKGHSTLSRKDTEGSNLLMTDLPLRIQYK